MSVSIIIPTYNGIEYLEQCIKSVKNSFFSDYELIVVNDGSTDNTSFLLNKIKGIKVVNHKQNLGLSKARNSGVKAAQGEIIVFLDDDLLVTKDWLKNLVHVFKEKDVGFVIGKIIYVDKNYNGYFPEKIVQNRDNWPMGGNIAFRKAVFKKVGLFDSLYYFKYNNEDTEFAVRASQYFNYKIASKAIAYHQKTYWSAKSLLNSAKNSSTWTALKKQYPQHYLVFKPDIRWNIINPKDYFYIILSPILIPVLLMRFIIHKQYNFKLFFLKWPVLLLLKRFYIWRRAIQNKVIMF